MQFNARDEGLETALAVRAVAGAPHGSVL